MTTNSDDWCSYTGHVPTPKGKKPGKIRCPLCRKRMTPQTLNGEPFGHFAPYYVIPMHKKPHGKRRQTPKKGREDPK